MSDPTPTFADHVQTLTESYANIKNDIVSIQKAKSVVEQLASMGINVGDSVTQISIQLDNTEKFLSEELEVELKALVDKVAAKAALIKEDTVQVN